MLGRLGFLVIMEVVKYRRWHKFSTNTKVMLTATLIVNLTAFVLLFLLERGNANTIGKLTLSEQLGASWFVAITTRTAGFNNIDFAQIIDSSTMLIVFLMCIGAFSQFYTHI